MYKMQDILNQVICGDAQSILQKIPNESINMSITSPPYYGLRAYKTKPQIWDGNSNCKHKWGKGISGAGKNNDQTARIIQKANKGSIGRDNRPDTYFCIKCGAWMGELGLEPTPQLYLQHLWLIYDEVKRVLKKDGVIFVNIADTYNGSGQDSGKQNRITSQDICNRPVGIAPIKPSYIKDYPKKCLLMIPERFAVGMVERGWILRNKICWAKSNPMPSSVKDRFTCTWEYIYFFSKSKRYYFDLDVIRVPLKTTTIERYGRNFGSPTNKYIGKDPKIIGGAKIDLRPKEFKVQDKGLVMVKNLHGGRNYRNKTANQSFKVGGMRPCPEPSDPEYKESIKGKNPGDHWVISTKPFRGVHFAVFPPDLCIKPIKAGCQQGGGG